MAERKCCDCRSERSEVYCCCEQLYLCKSCKNSHFGRLHLILDLSELLANQNLQDGSPKISPGSEKFFSLIQYISQQIEEIRKTAETHSSSLTKYFEINRSLPDLKELFDYAIIKNEDFLESLNPKQLLLYNLKDSKISEFNTETKITVETPINLDIISHPSTFQSENFLYILGGFMKANHNNDVIQVDLKNFTSKSVNSFKEKRLFGATLYKDEIFIAGGRKSEKNVGQLYLNDVDSYNIRSNSWSAMPKFEQVNYYVFLVVHKAFLYMALDKTGQVQKLSLSEREKFVTLPIKLPIADSYQLISHSDDIYLFSIEGIGKFSDTQNYETVYEIEDENLKANFNDLFLNTASQKNKLYFHDHSHVFTWSISEKKFSALKFE